MSENLKKELQHFLTIVAIGLGLWFGKTITQELIVVWLPACFLVGLLRTSLFVERIRDATIGALIDIATGLLVGIGIMLVGHSMFFTQIPVEVKKIAQTNMILGVLFFCVGMLTGARSTLDKYHP